jgi:hypothetical protein
MGFSFSDSSFLFTNIDQLLSAEPRAGKQHFVFFPHTEMNCTESPTSEEQTSFLPSRFSPIEERELARHRRQSPEVEALFRTSSAIASSEFDVETEESTARIHVRSDEAYSAPPREEEQA